MTRPITAPLTPDDTQIKLTFLRWLAIYPTITLVLWALGPLLFGRLPLPGVALVATLIVVPTVHYLLLPWLGQLVKGWVTVPTLRGAARHRMGLVLWLGSYPVITPTLLALFPALQGLPLPVMTLCIMLVAIPLVSLVVLPQMVRFLRPWIFARA
jgi:antibiotic biosynthesis monooxygenase (ABM) superfamily enzyme